MDYKKKYKETLERAKKLIETSVAYDRFTIEKIFPELCESEDERIRKRVIALVNAHGQGMYKDEMLAWLEKQGEQKSINDTDEDIVEAVKDISILDFAEPKFKVGDVLCDKSCTTLNKEYQPNFEITDIRNGMYICDKCSFPISQQDEYELVAKRIEQKTWSEEDEVGLGDALWAIEQARTIAKDENDMGNLWYAERWLKSLKQRIGG